MAILFVVSTFTGLAAAGEEEGVAGAPGAGFLPPSVDSAVDLAPLIEGADRLETAPLTDPQAAAELPHSDLGRSGAEELLQEVFGDGLEGPAAFYDELDVETFRSDHVAVIAPEHLGDAPGLVSSLLPLRTVDDSGERALVNLDLERAEGSLQPANPLVDVEIPTELSAGIELPGAGVSIDVGSGQIDRTASEVGDSTAFFPNIRPDSDFVVSAIPTGIETYTQLRSADAPNSETFNLSVEGDGQLRATDAGGAEIVDAGGKIRLAVSAPTAFDAQGDQVPVSLEVNGNSITVSAEPAEDTAYPVLVDPVWQYYNFDSANTSSWPGAGDWSRASNPGFGTEWGWPKNGMNAYAFKGATSPGNQATWNYYVPRYWTDIQAGLPAPKSYIRDMKLWGLTFTMPDEAAPYTAYAFMQMGLWSEQKEQFAAYYKRYGSEGPLTNLSYVYDLVNPNEDTNVKRGGFSIATFDSWNQAWRLVNVQYASAEVTDQNSPGFGELGSVPQWLNGQPGSAIPYIVSDEGLGIRQLQLKYPRIGGGSGLSTLSLGCTGIAESACPRTSVHSTNPITYDPSQMAQGENWVTVTATDPVEHTGSSTSRIKVDHTAPAASLSGNLTEQATVGTNLPEYTLNYAASDGDDAPAAATTPFGAAGTGQGQLERPSGVAVDGNGNVWTADATNNRVVEYDRSGAFVRQIGGLAASSATGQFNGPRGIAIAPNGTVWVADYGNKRLQAFTVSGAFIRQVVLNSWGDKLEGPFALAVAKDGSVWVSDIISHRLRHFSETGAFLGNAPDSTLASVDGLAIDSFGNIYATEVESSKVYEFNSGGVFKFSFGGEGTGNGQFKNIIGITTAPSGNIAVVDANNSRIQEFKPDGSYLRQFGTAGSLNNQLNEPRGLAFGPGNTLYVGDAGNHRIARWTHADQDPQSGAAKLQVKVDGVAAVTKEPGCATKNCAISGSWVMDADNYAVGPHQVDVVATDGVGLVTTKTLTVETHGDLQAPSVSLTGTITEQASLGNTRPTYKLKAAATDTGASAERKSGVASMRIKVDGVTVDSSAPGCPSGGCSLTREWTLTSSSYTVGTHLVEVKATDAAGRSTSKTLTINIERDTVPPDVTLTGTLPEAPEGWVQQEIRSTTAAAIDPNGYGVKRITFSIDGVQVGEGSLPTCSGGGCPGSKTFSMDMSAYSGGAHAAMVAAEDFAGNVRKRNWTINIDPSGSISVGEAVDTLEAVEETTPETTELTPVSELVTEAAGEGGVNPQLTLVNGEIESVGTPTPSTIGLDVEDGFTVDTVALDEAGTLYEGTIGAEPINPSSDAGTATIIDGSAAVIPNAGESVDTILRPAFDGMMTFQEIRDGAAPEDYSWRVNLDTDQSLILIDAQHAAVVWNDGPQAFLISSPGAHGADGEAVGTSLAVNGNVLTLHVSHRVPGIVYPVIGGVGWAGGFQTSQVVGPAPEQPQGEEIYSDGVLGAPVPYPMESADRDGEGPWSGSSPVFKYLQEFRFRQCSFDGVQNLQCGDWEQAMKGFFWYNYKKAWYPDREPKCPNSGTVGIEVDWSVCEWVGAKYARSWEPGEHITARVLYKIHYLIKGTFSDNRHMAVYAYPSGYANEHDTDCICNPSIPD
jgi:hypothetical protein